MNRGKWQEKYYESLLLLLLLFLFSSPPHKSSIFHSPSQFTLTFSTQYRVLILEAVRLVDNHIVPIDLAQLRLLANRHLVGRDADIKVHRFQAVANQGVLESGGRRRMKKKVGEGKRDTATQRVRETNRKTQKSIERRNSEKKE